MRDSKVLRVETYRIKQNRMQNRARLLTVSIIFKKVLLVHLLGEQSATVERGLLSGVKSGTNDLEFHH